MNVQNELADAAQHQTQRHTSFMSKIEQIQRQLKRRDMLRALSPQQAVIEEKIEPKPSVSSFNRTTDFTQRINQLQMKLHQVANRVREQSHQKQPQINFQIVSQRRDFYQLLAYRFDRVIQRNKKHAFFLIKKAKTSPPRYPIDRRARTRNRASTVFRSSSQKSPKRLVAQQRKPMQKVRFQVPYQTVEGNSDESDNNSQLLVRKQGQSMASLICQSELLHRELTQEPIAACSEDDEIDLVEQPSSNIEPSFVGEKVDEEKRTKDIVGYIQRFRDRQNRPNNLEAELCPVNVQPSQPMSFLLPVGQSRQVVDQQLQVRRSGTFGVELLTNDNMDAVDDASKPEKLAEAPAATIIEVSFSERAIDVKPKMKDRIQQLKSELTQSLPSDQPKQKLAFIDRIKLKKRKDVIVKLFDRLIKRKALQTWLEAWYNWKRFDRAIQIMLKIAKRNEKVRAQLKLKAFGLIKWSAVEHERSSLLNENQRLVSELNSERVRLRQAEEERQKTELSRQQEKKSNDVQFVQRLIRKLDKVFTIMDRVYQRQAVAGIRRQARLVALRHGMIDKVQATALRLCRLRQRADRLNKQVVKQDAFRQWLLHVSHMYKNELAEEKAARKAALKPVGLIQKLTAQAALHLKRTVMRALREQVELAKVNRIKILNLQKTIARLQAVRMKETFNLFKTLSDKSRLEEQQKVFRQKLSSVWTMQAVMDGSCKRHLKQALQLIQKENNERLCLSSSGVLPGSPSRDAKNPISSEEQECVVVEEEDNEKEYAPKGAHQTRSNDEFEKIFQSLASKASAGINNYREDDRSSPNLGSTQFLRQLGVRRTCAYPSSQSHQQQVHLTETEEEKEAVNRYDTQRKTNADPNTQSGRSSSQVRKSRSQHILKCSLVNELVSKEHTDEPEQPYHCVSALDLGELMEASKQDQQQNESENQLNVQSSKRPLIVPAAIEEKNSSEHKSDSRRHFSRSRRSMLESLRSNRSQSCHKGQFSTRQKVISNIVSIEQDDIVLSSPRQDEEVLQITTRNDELQQMAAEYRGNESPNKQSDNQDPSSLILLHNVSQMPTTQRPRNRSTSRYEEFCEDDDDSVVADENRSADGDTVLMIAGLNNDDKSQHYHSAKQNDRRISVDGYQRRRTNTNFIPRRLSDDDYSKPFELRYNQTVLGSDHSKERKAPAGLSSERSQQAEVNQSPYKALTLTVNHTHEDVRMNMLRSSEEDPPIYEANQMIRQSENQKDAASLNILGISAESAIYQASGTDEAGHLTGTVEENIKNMFSVVDAPVNLRHEENKLLSSADDQTAKHSLLWSKEHHEIYRDSQQTVVKQEDSKQIPNAMFAYIKNLNQSKRTVGESIGSVTELPRQFLTLPEAEDMHIEDMPNESASDGKHSPRTGSPRLQEIKDPLIQCSSLFDMAKDKLKSPRKPSKQVLSPAHSPRNNSLNPMSSAESRERVVRNFDTTCTPKKPKQKISPTKQDSMKKSSAKKNSFLHSKNQAPPVELVRLNMISKMSKELRKEGAGPQYRSLFDRVRDENSKKREGCTQVLDSDVSLMMKPIVERIKLQIKGYQNQKQVIKTTKSPTAVKKASPYGGKQPVATPRFMADKKSEHDDAVTPSRYVSFGPTTSQKSSAVKRPSLVSDKSLRCNTKILVQDVEGSSEQTPSLMGGSASRASLGSPASLTNGLPLSTLHRHSDALKSNKPMLPSSGKPPAPPRLSSGKASSSSKKRPVAQLSAGKRALMFANKAAHTTNTQLRQRGRVASCTSSDLNQNGENLRYFSSSEGGD